MKIFGIYAGPLSPNGSHFSCFHITCIFSDFDFRHVNCLLSEAGVEFGYDIITELIVTELAHLS